MYVPQTSPDHNLPVFATNALLECNIVLFPKNRVTPEEPHC